MFSPKRWNRADLIISLALLLAVTLCSPILVAIDDEDNDLPPVILPVNKPGGGSEGNRAGYINPIYPTFEHDLGGPWIRRHVGVVFDASVQMLTVPSAESVPGVQVSGCHGGVIMTLAQAGSSGVPKEPDAQINVTAPLGITLKVLMDDATFVIRNHYAMSTSLNEILADIFQLDVNSGIDTVSGMTCVATGDLSGISARALHKAVLNGSVESKVFLPNNGSADLTRLIELAEDDLRNEVFDLGVIQVGYDDMGNVMTITNVIVTATSGGIECPVDIRVCTID
jgi:hypothetical protein